MLVGGADVNDRGWKTRYFFVEKSSLGVAGKFLRDGWHSSGILHPHEIAPYFS